MLTIILVHVQRGRAYGIRPHFFFLFPSCFLHKRRATDESRTRDLFLTKEALYHWATAACFFSLSSFRVPFLFRALAGWLLSPLVWSGRRGSNPPPIAWKAIALPNELLPQGVWGRVDSNHRTLPRTDLQSVAIATMRLPHFLPPYLIY